MGNKGVKIPVAKPTTTTLVNPVSSATPTPTPMPTPMPSQCDLKTIIRAEIAFHNTESDCWTYVDGKVYEGSNWLPEHPGGAFLV